MLGSAPMECLGDETIAAYVDGALEPVAIKRIDHHIDSCAGCRAQLSAVAAIPVVHSFVSEAVGSSPPVDLALAIAASLPGEELPEVAIGRYIVHRVIGRGGMGVVLRARDPELEREVAIKLVDPSAAQHPPANGSRGSGGWRARLRAEARAMAKLRHPNVVTVYDAGAVGNQLFVAMELVDGENLGRHLARDRRAALELCIAAGRGLCAAHAAGLVHGDVKPDNVLVDRDGRALIGDFGLTRAIALGGPADSAIVGTPAYMAPELLRRKPADPRSDQFALAVTVYEACTGERPWRAESIDRLLEAIEQAPRTRPAGLSRAVWRVVARGRAPDPDARYPSVVSFVDALERARRSGAARRRRVGFVAATTVAVAAIASALIWQGSHGAVATCEDPVDRVASMTGAGLCGASPSSPCAALTTELASRAAAWRKTFVGVCRATQDGQQSAELLDRRMHCLDDRQLEHVALVAKQASPPDNAAAFAALAALQHLDRPETCATSDRAAIAIPAAKQAAIAEAGAWVASAKVDYALGHYQVGRVALSAHFDAIRMIGHPPLTAAAATVLGELDAQSGDLAGAETFYDLGLRAAAEASDDAATASLLLDRAYVVGESRQQWARGAELLRAADAAVVRAGTPPALDATLRLEQGLMAEDTGDFASARTHYSDALALRRTYADPGDIAVALERLCATDGQVGKLDEGRTHCTEALDMIRGALGVDHPLVAQAESELGVAVAITGDLAGARRHWEAALATLERGLGNKAPGLAAVLLDLADVSRELGDPAAADRYLARALDLAGNPATSPDNLDVQLRLATQLRAHGQIAEGLARLEDLARRAEVTLGPLHPTTAHAYAELGDAYYETDHYAEARATYDKAVKASTAIYGALHPTTLGMMGRLGQAMMEMKDVNAARPVFQQAMVGLEAAGQPDSAVLASAYTNFADCLTTLGDAKAAVEPATKALAIQEKRGDSPLQTSEARYVLAQALWKARRDPGAVALARKARDEMRAIGPSASSLPDIERWLAGAR